MRLATAVVAALLALAVGAADAGAADWRDATKVLRVGFLSSASPAGDVKRLEPFRAYLETRISLPVELVPATTAAALIDAEVTGRVAYAIDSAAGYATAAAECACVEPLAAPIAADGSRGYHAILVVRADSPIHDLAGMAGSRLAVSAADSLAGRLVPMKAFATAGIDPATHFASLFEAPGPEDAIAAVLDGRADVATGWSSIEGDAASGYSFGVLTRMVLERRLAMDRVSIVWQSPLIPFGPHVVRKEMPPELKALLSNALTAMAKEAPDVLDAVDRSTFTGGGFAAVGAADYAVVEALVAPSGG
ncbi:MAG TPA: phosphate/phosphite/phosphonate ABC transporter substrate-binding protein [Bauldia sp.]